MNPPMVLLTVDSLKASFNDGFLVEEEEVIPAGPLLTVDDESREGMTDTVVRLTRTCRTTHDLVLSERSLENVDKQLFHDYTPFQKTESIKKQNLPNIPWEVSRVYPGYSRRDSPTQTVLVDFF